MYSLSYHFAFLLYRVASNSSSNLWFFFALYNLFLSRYRLSAIPKSVRNKKIDLLNLKKREGKETHRETKIDT